VAITGKPPVFIKDKNSFTFGRYSFTRDRLLDEAEAAGKPQAVIALLGVIKIEDLLDAAQVEASMNPVDDEAGWDETSQLLAAASSVAHIGLKNLRTILDKNNKQS
jgi:hypothetical protein